MRGLVVLTVVLAAAPAAADGAKSLGTAFRAYEAGDLAKAGAALKAIDVEAISNRDYVYWLRGMVALRTGNYDTAEKAFEKLGKQAGSRFRDEAPWRLADVTWERGDTNAAAKAYAKLLRGIRTGSRGVEARPDAGDPADVGTAMFRIAQTKASGTAPAAYREFVLAYPDHPFAPRAEQLLVSLGAPALTATERIERAKRLTERHAWDEAIAELSLLDRATLPDAVRDQRDYWLATTLFKMRRRYGEAGALLLDVYPRTADPAEAMFHGARALSRADRDDEAIQWYRKVVATYPKTPWAEEAQFLSGWLELNRAKFKDAIGPLEELLARYPKSKWVDDALWFLGLAHYSLGEYPKAKQRLEALAKTGGALEGGKGQYWLARIDDRLQTGGAARPAAISGYTQVIQKYPFSWYALLAHARLKALGTELPPFGFTDPKPRGPKLSATVDESLASDDLIARADELIAAGLTVDAGDELVRGEKAFLKRHDRSAGFAILLDRYVKAGNYNRPWLLSLVSNGGALDGPPVGDARRWWENAYPRAYRDLVEKYEKLGTNPSGYLYSIMRKESGFDPHNLSYADAQGLLQMIPPTTKRVVKELGLPYDPGRLYEPAYNIQTGSWYIGHLLAKFKNQIPLGSGSFNSGPSPVMKWIDRYGSREIDELVELVPFTQTREYMKKVTENYARYRYLYDNVVYEQPLAVTGYIKDTLTY